MRYRKILYDRYLSTHFSQIRELSLKALKENEYIYRSYYQPFLPQDKNTRILDLGCGYGPLVYFLQQKGYTNVLGIDASQEQVHAARQLGIQNVIRADIFDFLVSEENEFDCIFALDVLEHFSKEEAFMLLEHVARALNPGGQLILHVPNAASPFFGAVFFADYTHELAFTAKSISQVLEATGFSRVRTYPSGPISHGLKSSIRWLLWQGINFLLRAYFLIETGQLERQIFTQNLIAVADKQTAESIHE